MFASIRGANRSIRPRHVVDRHGSAADDELRTWGQWVKPFDVGAGAGKRTLRVDLSGDEKCVGGWLLSQHRSSNPTGNDRERQNGFHDSVALRPLPPALAT